MFTSSTLPSRIVVATAVTGFVACYWGAVFWLCLRIRLIEPFQSIIPLVIGVASAQVAPHVFPFWRHALSIADRKRLISGAIFGPFLGFPLALLASFAMLDPNLGAPIQSQRMMAFIYLVVAASGLIGSYIAADRPKTHLGASNGQTPGAS
jgi:hypothetical protein